MAKHVTYRFRLLIVALLVAVSANAQQLGLKTNLLYWATTTPNFRPVVSIPSRPSTASTPGSLKTIRAYAIGSSSRNTATGSARRSTAGFSACMLWADNSMPEASRCRSDCSKSLRITDTKDGLQVADSQPAISGHCPNTGTWRLRSV